MLAMEGKSALPMPISPFGTKEEIPLKVPKQGLNKIGIGMDTCSLAIGCILSKNTFQSNTFLSRKTGHTTSCRNWCKFILGVYSCCSPSDSNSTSLRELWRRHAAPEDAFSGQQLEQLEQ